MVEVNYSHRIICDCHFIEWLSKRSNNSLVLSNLMYIKASSKFHRNDHNLILETELDTCLEQEWLSEGKIRASFKKTEEPAFLDIHEDNITKNIVFSIYVTSGRPYGCYIFTSPDKVDEYEKNPHYKDIQVIRIKGGEDAVKVAREFFRAFTLAKEKIS